MSAGVVRGSPTAAQRHVDRVLALAQGSAARVSMPQLMHFCLKSAPDRVFMTNGSTGARVTCRQLLELAVPLARALRAAGLAGRRAVLATRGHECAVAVYLGLAFAGVETFIADPAATLFELQYYMQLVDPSVVFCDAATQASVATAAGERARTVLAVHTDQLLEFVRDHRQNIDEYRVSDADPYGAMVLLPTSGSTGMPKAAILNHSGLIQQLATPWAYHEQFPTPTARSMVTTTPQWATFTMMLTSCCVFQVELLISPELPTVDHVLQMMETYQPTWTFFGPAFAKALADAGAPRHFASLDTVLTLGSHVTPEILAALKAKLPESGSVLDGYGMTEAQGFVALPAPCAPLGCNGTVANILHYKLVKDDGTIADVGKEGELYLKGDCIIKGYLKSELELAQSLADGWLRTGDAFTSDLDGRLYYQRRIKFSFKYNNLLVCPEEVEGVVESLPFVAECVVCERAGPAAAVVLRANAPSHVDARKAIHDLIQSTLSEHKRLRGGIAFVEQLPLTHTGKLNRAKCRELLDQLPADQLRC